MPGADEQKAEKAALSQFARELELALGDYGIPGVAANQREQLLQHYRLLRAWNRRVNLTRMIDPEEAARLHYADSLFAGGFLGQTRTMVDIGSGAGFPAIPLAVLRPDVRVTALEANQRKSVFLSEARDALRLTNLVVVTARVESMDLSSFDVLTSRALDRASEILPRIIERIEVRQRFLLFSGADLLREIESRLPPGQRLEKHPIPRTESRYLGILSRVH